MQKRWVLKSQGSPALVENLSNQLNCGSILCNLIAQRGIETFDDARNFFRPDLNHLHDPFLMKDMDKAVERIEAAIMNKEKILVYGDYDVDGTTSVALMYTFLKSIYSEVGFYLPCRHAEGYGISFLGIDYAKENGYSLIVALDCGIKANEKVDYANERNIDFIICDHHRPGDSLPNAAAVLDPKRADCNYPYDELSGCGIGFKLIQGFAQRHNIPFVQLEPYLDLCAISIAADIVPITGENRVLAHYGLRELNKKPRPGIQAILELNNHKKVLTISDLVFLIGPRLNAAGRIENAKAAVELLITNTKEKALTAGIGINSVNADRRTLDLSITEQALDMIRADFNFETRKTTVLFGPDWHKGVIGIVASRLTEKYYRPTVILTRNEQMATGSARSVKDFDIYNAIESCSDLLEQFGGHKYAAGLTLKVENVAAFQIKFEQVVSSTIEDRMLVQEFEIDAEIRLKDITPSFFKVLKQFAPFGPGNMAPIFKSSAVFDKGYGRVVGSNHLKLSLCEPGMDNSLDAIGFQLGEFFPLISKQIPFDICYTIEENEWNGKTTLQLNLKDVRVPGAVS